MNIILGILCLWLGMSIPLAVALGRAIRIADRKEGTEG